MDPRVPDFDGVRRGAHVRDDAGAGHRLDRVVRRRRDPVGPPGLGAEVLTTLPCASFRDVVLRTESGVEVAGTVRAAVPQPTAVQLAPACLLEVVPLGDPWPAGLVGQRVIFAR